MHVTHYLCDVVAIATTPRVRQADKFATLRKNAASHLALYKDIISFEFKQSMNTSGADSRVSYMNRPLHCINMCAKVEVFANWNGETTKLNFECNVDGTTAIVTTVIVTIILMKKLFQVRILDAFIKLKCFTGVQTLRKHWILSTRRLRQPNILRQIHRVCHLHGYTWYVYST